MNISPPHVSRTSHPANACLHQRVRGFTLIELFIVLAIASILLAMTAPVLRQWYDDASVNAQLGRLSSTLAVARSAALKFGASVVLCASDDGSTCSGQWSDGWIVFRDDDADGAFSELERLLLVERDSNARTSMTSGTTVYDSLAFDHRGYPEREVLVTTTRGSISASIGISAIGRTLAQ